MKAKTKSSTSTFCYKKKKASLSESWVADLLGTVTDGGRSAVLGSRLNRRFSLSSKQYRIFLLNIISPYMFRSEQDFVRNIYKCCAPDLYNFIKHQLRQPARDLPK